MLTSWSSSQESSAASTTPNGALPSAKPTTKMRWSPQSTHVDKTAEGKAAGRRPSVGSVATRATLTVYQGSCDLR